MTIPTAGNGMRPIHPGEILREDYLRPLGLDADTLARIIEAPASRIDDIVQECGDMTADIAARLVRHFGGDVQSWMNLQTAYEAGVTERRSAWTRDSAARFRPGRRG